MTSHRATYNFEDFSAEEFDLVRRVLTSMGEVIEDVQDRTMLIGAQARDLIHRRLGKPGHFLRTSIDVDLAIAVASASDYERLTSRFQPRRSTSDVRYIVGGLPVDLIPFGEIEEPEGQAKVRQNTSPFSVFAYKSAFEAADRYLLPRDCRVNVVDPLHYIALKLDAWVDRSKDHQYKDADDLRIAFDWFRESPDYLRRIYDGSPSAAERWDWDAELACLWLLGSDVARTIGSANTTFIAEKWNEASRVALARRIGKPLIGSSGRKSVQEVQALASGLETLRVAE